jgi:hypothetical protein
MLLYRDSPSTSKPKKSNRVVYFPYQNRGSGFGIVLRVF